MITTTVNMVQNHVVTFTKGPLIFDLHGVKMKLQLLFFYWDLHKHKVEQETSKVKHYIGVLYFYKLISFVLVK